VEPGRRTLTSADGTRLEGDLALPNGPSRAAMVLCHPHPQYGGTMRSIVIGALFSALPPAGIVCLRFNFRGVEASEGTWDEGEGERADAAAAVHELTQAADPAVPLVLAGWSFGADIALSVLDPAITGWLAIAPAMRYTSDLADIAADARPKQFVLAEHDELHPPNEITAITRAWSATETTVVPGASHFFVGRTDRVVDAALAFVDQVTASC
jgi:alpha/beta superfamily hydrolase